MKNNISLSFRALALCSAILAFSHASMGQISSDYGNLYLNKSTFKDLRVHDNSHIGIVIMAPIDIDLPKVIDEGLYPDDPEDYNRLPESGFPGIRFFKPNRTMTFSLLYARKAYKFDGSGDANIGSTYSNYLEKQSKSRIAMRFAYDWHFKPNRFRYFDMDHYLGYSLNTGVAPSKSIKEEEFISGNSNTLTVTSNPLTFGGDAYWGVNFKFEYFSLGAEFLLFGLDYQKNVGRDKIEQETTIGSVSTSNTYYQTDYLQGDQFSSLKSSSSQITMFKGFRLVAIIYLKKPNN